MLSSEEDEEDEEEYEDEDEDEEKGGEGDGGLDDEDEEILAIFKDEFCCSSTLVVARFCLRERVEPMAKPGERHAATTVYWCSWGDNDEGDSVVASTKTRKTTKYLLNSLSLRKDDTVLIGL